MTSPNNRRRWARLLEQPTGAPAPVAWVNAVKWQHPGLRPRAPVRRDRKDPSRSSAHPTAQLCRGASSITVNPVRDLYGLKICRTRVRAVTLVPTSARQQSQPRLPTRSAPTHSNRGETAVTRHPSWKTSWPGSSAENVDPQGQNDAPVAFSDG